MNDEPTPQTQQFGSIAVRTYQDGADVVFVLVPSGSPKDFKGETLARVPIVLLEADPLKETGGVANARPRPKLYRDLCAAFMDYIARLQAQAGIELSGGPSESATPSTEQPLTRSERRAAERRFRSLNGGRH